MHAVSGTFFLYGGSMARAAHTAQTAPASRVPVVVRSWLIAHCPHLLVPLTYCLLTALMLPSLVGTLGSAVPDTDGDPLLNAWAMRWVQHILVTDPARFYDGNIFAPAPRSLAFSEALLPQALTAWPLWLLTRDALVMYNLSVLLTYVACAVAMYALCRALGANRGASFVAGFLYAFAPFRLDNASHLQVLSMQGMPLTLLAVMRYVQQPSWRRGTLVALAFAYLALSSVYFLVMFGTGLAVFLVVEAVRQRRVLLSRAGVGLALWLLVAVGGVALFDLPYLRVRDEQGISRTLNEAYDDAAKRDSYLTVLPGSLLWGRALPHAGVERAALFPGATLLALAAVGLIAAWCRPWVPGLVAAGVVGFVLSFGPTWGDKENGRPLPYRWLYEHVLPFQGLRGPDRFATLVLLALAPLAALGATALWRRFAPRTSPAPFRKSGRRIALGFVAATALVGVGIVDNGTQLAPVVPVDRSDAALAPYRRLAGYGDAGTVAEFPADTGSIRTGFYSTLHWHPVLWGHSGFIPEAHYRLLQRFTGRGDPVPGTDDLDALADMGVHTLVIHREQYAAAELARMEGDFARVPDRVRFLARAGDADLYALTAALPAEFEATINLTATEVGATGSVPGEITVRNPGRTARMLYTAIRPPLVVVVRDTAGREVLRGRLDISIPAMVERGTHTYPFTIPFPRTPGDYTATVDVAPFVRGVALAPTPVRVLDPTALPPLTLNGGTVRGPALFTPGEVIAMWATLRDGRTVPLRDARAAPDRTLTADLGAVPPGAARIVARGKTSGVELFVSP